MAFVLAYLLFAYSSILGFVQGATSANANVAFQETAYAMSAAAAAYAASVSHGRRRWAWGLLAAASVLAALGLLAISLFPGVLAQVPFRFGQFLLVNGARLTGLFLLLPSKLRYERKAGVMVDALVAAGSQFIILWVLVLGAVFDSSQATFSDRVTISLYPSLGVAVLTIVIVVFSRTPLEVRSPMRYLLAAWSIAALSGPVYAYFTLQGHAWAAYIGPGVVVVGHSLQALASLRVVGSPEFDAPVHLKRAGWTAFIPYVPLLVAVPVTVADYDGAVSPVVFAVGVGIVLLLFARLLLMQRENVRINRELAESAAFKTEMLRFIGHEIANPLTPLMFQNSLLAEARQRGALDEQERKNLEIFSRSLNRLQSLSRDVRSLAQLDAGTLPIERARHDLVEETRKAIDSARPAAEAKRLKVDFLAPKAPAWAHVDAQRYGQVVDNLVSNAIKFTPHGGKIGIAILPEAAHWALVVEDTGLGLSPEQGKRLFTAFGRAHGNLAPGLGLGLVICKAIVEGHGGAISVESQGPNRGTQFRATFPALSRPPPEAMQHMDTEA